MREENRNFDRGFTLLSIILFLFVGGLIGHRPSSAAPGHVRQVTCDWSENFPTSDLDGTVWDMAIFNDGTGLALYVGGTFLHASGVPVNHVARWDGTSWSALPGTSAIGVDDEVRALAVYDDGSGEALYVGGDFIVAGGTGASYVARWDGSSWTELQGSLGSGTGGPVWSMAVHDDGDGRALFVGGEFVDAGGVIVNNIARWDGSDWSALVGASGTGTNNEVLSMASHDDGSGETLFVGGRFSWAGGIPVSYIARWNGSEWAPLQGPSGTGLGSWVEDLAVFDDGGGAALYAGGQFTTAGGQPANRVARWNGVEWSSLDGPSGNGTDGIVWTLEVFGTDLIAAGQFDQAGGIAVNRVAQWDGSQWAEMSGPSGVGVQRTVDSLIVFDDGNGEALYAGGSIHLAGGEFANSITRWNGVEWSPLDQALGQGINGAVYALEAYDDGTGIVAVAGGNFGAAGDATAKNIAVWDTRSWSPLVTGGGAEGTDGLVEALAVFDNGSGPELYAAGWFDTAAGVNVNRIARWTGVDWTPLTAPGGTGVQGGNSIRALAVYDDGTGSKLYAGGYFETAGGVTVNDIASWDGSVWTPLTGSFGTGVQGRVEEMTVFDFGDGPSLIVAGAFTSAGGMTVNNIARWDGSEWYPIGNPSDPGFNSTVEALAIFDNGTGATLYAGGNFARAGTSTTNPVTVNHIARWSSGLWVALDDGLAIGTPGTVYELETFTGGADGPSLIVGVTSTVIGSIPASYVAAWNGTAWSTLDGSHGEGLNARPRAMLDFIAGTGRALLVGGGFQIAGGVASRNIARWRCAPEDLIFDSGFEPGSLVEWSSSLR